MSDIQTSKWPNTDLRTEIARALLGDAYPDESWDDAIENGEDAGWLKAADSVIVVLERRKQPQDAAEGPLLSGRLRNRANMADPNTGTVEVSAAILLEAADALDTRVQADAEAESQPQPGGGWAEPCKKCGHRKAWHYDECISPSRPGETFSACFTIGPTGGPGESCACDGFVA